MGRRLVRWVKAGLPGLAVVGLLSGTVAVLVHRDRAESERWREAEKARIASREAVFARGQLGEMLELCREGWSGQLNFNYEPVALAWSRQGVDAYFVQGVDQTSLRQVLAEYKVLDEKALTKRVKKLEKEMLDAAKNLEFEKAAELRDQLKQLKQVLFGVEEHD